jgi:hypothetical protein
MIHWDIRLKTLTLSLQYVIQYALCPEEKRPPKRDEARAAYSKAPPPQLSYLKLVVKHETNTIPI